jgi:hypothetical protein
MLIEYISLSRRGGGFTVKRKRKCTLFVCFALFLIMVTMPSQVLSVLGESTASIQLDKASLSAHKSAMTVHKGYTVHEIHTASAMIREYVSPSGIVFGIAWNGLVNPDLSQLLGGYAAEYEKAMMQTPRKHGRRNLQVKTNLVIVEKWGHMRNLQGRAYAPDLIPPGVNIGEIR